MNEFQWHNFFTDFTITINMRNVTLNKTAVSLFIISLILVGVILAKNVLIPLAISFLFAYLLYPLAWRIERNGVHRIFSILIVILSALVVIAAIAFYFSVQISNIHFACVYFFYSFLPDQNSLVYSEAYRSRKEKKNGTDFT